MYYQTRARFGAEVKRRIMIGTFVLSAGYYDAYYVKAQKVRALIRKDYDEAFAQVDVVALPTSPTVGVQARRADRRIRSRCTWRTCSRPRRTSPGLPAISMPCGLTTESLPVGLQLTARPFDEADAAARAGSSAAMEPRGSFTADGRRRRFASDEQPDDHRRAPRNGQQRDDEDERRQHATRRVPTTNRIGPTTSITTPMTSHLTRSSGSRTA